MYDSLISVFSGGDSFLCGVPCIRLCVFCCRHGAVRSGKTTAGVPKVFTELKCRFSLTARKPHFVIHRDFRSYDSVYCTALRAG